MLNRFSYPNKLLYIGQLSTNCGRKTFRLAGGLRKSLYTFPFQSANRHFQAKC
jgi:hypothetical protein